MTEHAQLQQQLTDLFTNRLNLEVPSVEADLVETGVLDSLTLIDLLLSLEQEFEVKISLEEIAIDNFRSIASIAQFVGRGSFSKMATFFIFNSLAAVVSL
ncbi:MAG: phosphopantetheine-binding protein [Blastocatellia bacterium]